ncbi:hypothetical protein Patl1_06499 [Pistacia atlantica]|uniref:Uncharacterized protein n=1 Tax=Pistacia atlantica TaxID=434234 RepID=A0ACC1BUW4_9ROSI|nr:hypothetical protein Patl1_06499 [Pistacia atlantica]
MEIQSESSMRRRVILFPLPLQGHITPMLQLANGLSEAVVSVADAVAVMTQVNDNCVEPFRDCLSKLLSNVEEEPIACLITDAMLHFTQSVADSLKLPRIVLRTSNISSFLVFAGTPLLHEKGYLPIKDPLSDAPVIEFPPLRVKDIPVVETHDPVKGQHLLLSMISQTKASSGLIWNSCEEIEQDAVTTLKQEFPIPIFTVGPFHKYFPAASSSLLSQDRSCISCLGTRPIARWPFLWVVRPGSVHGAEWLEALPRGFLEMLDGRGHIVKWAPQQEILAHPATGGFWTHNGWNSTLESICEGVPMICHPSFGDQQVIARYVSDVWRVGLHLEKKLEKGEIERAVKRLILEDEGQEIRNRTMDLKEKVDNFSKARGFGISGFRELG